MKVLKTPDNYSANRDQKLFELRVIYISLESYAHKSNCNILALWFEHWFGFACNNFVDVVRI